LRKRCLGIANPLAKPFQLRAIRLKVVEHFAGWPLFAAANLVAQILIEELGIARQIG
jgi:hypothetical protein